MYIALLIISIVLTVCKSTFYNTYAKKGNDGIHSIYLFNTITFIIGTVVLLASNIIFDTFRDISLYTVITAFAYGLIVFLLQTFSVKAMSIGPMSVTALLVLYGMVIPAVAGPIFWKEPFGVLQIIGVFIMLVSNFLLNKKGDAEEKASGKWLFLAVLCFLLSGTVGIVEKVHQTSIYKDERTMMLLIAYFMMFCFSLVGSVVTKDKNNKVAFAPAGRYGLLAGISVGFLCQINITLAGALNTLIYYPISNGGAVILTLLVSRFLFKERFSGKQTIGFILGLISIIAISLPY